MIAPLQAVGSRCCSKRSCDGFIAAARAALWPRPSNIGQPDKIISPQQGSPAQEDLGLEHTGFTSTDLFETRIRQRGFEASDPFRASAPPSCIISELLEDFDSFSRVTRCQRGPAVVCGQSSACAGGEARSCSLPLVSTCFSPSRDMNRLILFKCAWL